MSVSVQTITELSILQLNLGIKKMAQNAAIVAALKINTDMMVVAE